MDDATLSVSELAGLLRGALDMCFEAGVWVQGEIRSLTRSRSGHVYFDLVETPDDNSSGGSAGGDGSGAVIATISVALFADARERVNSIIKAHGNPMRMSDGVRIRIHGFLDYYPPMGRLQLKMASIDPEFTLGTMASARDALLAELARTGRLRANADRPLPAVPQRIGLVTSLGSAAHADMLRVFERSGLAFAIVEADTPVQGIGAERRIAAALRAVAAASCELVILARGGGAKTDLAVFDHAVVAEAIAGSAIPVFCGIGHEIDRSVADETAHTACATPTAAASAVVDIAEAWLARLAGHEQTLAHVGRRAATSAGRRLDGASRQLVRASGRVASSASGRLDQAAARAGVAARGRLRGAAARLDPLAARAGVAARGILRGAQSRTDSAQARVRALDPALALARGWSITRSADGAVLRSVADAPPGTQISTRLADGTIASTVSDVKTGDV